MSKQVRLRRGTTLQHLSFVGAEGEVTYDTERKCLLVHDGVSLGGRAVTAVAFTDRQRAGEFERYLKTASGRAFAKKRL